jgi:hypothetical protein
MKEARSRRLWLKSEGDAIGGEAIMRWWNQTRLTDMDGSSEDGFAKIIAQEGEMAPVGKR